MTMMSMPCAQKLPPSCPSPMAYPALSNCHRRRSLQPPSRRTLVRVAECLAQHPSTATHTPSTALLEEVVSSVTARTARRRDVAKFRVPQPKEFSSSTDVGLGLRIGLRIFGLVSQVRARRAQRSPTAKRRPAWSAADADGAEQGARRSKLASPFTRPSRKQVCV